MHLAPDAVDVGDAALSLKLRLGGVRVVIDRHSGGGALGQVTSTLLNPKARGAHALCVRDVLHLRGPLTLSLMPAHLTGGLIVAVFAPFDVRLIHMLLYRAPLPQPQYTIGADMSERAGKAPVGVREAARKVRVHDALIQGVGVKHLRVRQGGRRAYAVVLAQPEEQRGDTRFHIGILESRDKRRAVHRDVVVLDVRDLYDKEGWGKERDRSASASRTHPPRPTTRKMIVDGERLTRYWPDQKPLRLPRE